MSTWSGTFTVINNTGQTIYNGQVAHTAANCPSTPITIPSTGLSSGAQLGGGTWQTETTSRDFWSWNYQFNSSSPSVTVSEKQCSLYHADSSVIITLTASGGTITPNNSGACTVSND